MNKAAESSVIEGRICIQSEGAKWECPRITIKPLKHMIVFLQLSCYLSVFWSGIGDSVLSMALL